MNSQKVGGDWLFRGTRIPISALFENLAAGATTKQFVEWFPGVTMQQVDEVIAYSRRKFGLPADR